MNDVKPPARKAEKTLPGNDMPANLTPDYLAADRAFKEAKTDEERIAALEEMLRTIPKHKGTDKMQADIKRRISKVRQAAEKQSAKKGGFSHRVLPEGAGQIALAGGPNTGKSRLLKALTNAEPQVAPYPFTTVLPMPGMMDFEDIQIQLVDLPPFSPDHTESWLPEMFRAANAVMMVLDLSGDPLQDYDFIIERLDKVKICLVRDPDPEAPFNISQKRTMIVCNKLDADGAAENFEALRELIGERFPMIAVSVEQGTHLDLLRRAAFDLLQIIRIRPKEPGKPASKDQPFTVPRGSNLMDFAKVVHKDFENLKYARVWGLSSRFDGQTVTRDHILADGDIVELHL